MFCVMGNMRIQATATQLNRHERTSSALDELREGISYIWRSKLFRWLIGLTFVGMFFAQSYVQIMPVFTELLNSDERGYGYLLSAGGLGSVLGTLIIGSVQQHERLGTIMLLGAALSVLALFGFAASAQLASFAFALLFVFLSALFASVFMITSMTVLQLRVPDDLRGRVMGIHTIGYSLMPLGGLFLGSLTEFSGAAWAVLIGSSIYLAAISIAWFSQSGLRNLNNDAVEPGRC